MDVTGVTQMRVGMTLCVFQTKRRTEISTKIRTRRFAVFSQVEGYLLKYVIELRKLPINKISTGKIVLDLLLFSLVLIFRGI